MKRELNSSQNNREANGKACQSSQRFQASPDKVGAGPDTPKGAGSIAGTDEPEDDQPHLKTLGMFYILEQDHVRIYLSFNAK